MSSPERAKSAKAAVKPGAKPASKSAAKPAADRKATAKRAKTKAETEPTGAEKAAFLKAMAKGIEPGTVAARKVAAKKDGLPDTAEATPSLARDPADQQPEPPKVELLRRIPAAPKVENTPESEQALRLAAMIEKTVEDGALGKVQPHAQQALIGALVKLYAANAEAGDRYAPLGMRSAVTATDVMVICGALLKAVDLQVFELGMWQSWSSG